MILSLPQKIFFILLCMLMPFLSISQAHTLEGRALYFKLGLNKTNMVNWDDGTPTYPLTRLFGGIGVFARLGKPGRITTAIAMEANISGQGFAMKNNDEKIRARLSFLNFSVMPRQYFGHFYLTLGPEVGILLSAHEVLNGRREQSPIGIYSKSAFNGIAGAGFNFGKKDTRQVDFGLELSYKRGFTKIRTDFTHARHSVFAFSVFLPVAIFADLRSYRNW